MTAGMRSAVIWTPHTQYVGMCGCVRRLRHCECGSDQQTAKSHRRFSLRHFYWTFFTTQSCRPNRCRFYDLINSTLWKLLYDTVTIHTYRSFRRIETGNMVSLSSSSFKFKHSFVLSTVARKAPEDTKLNTIYYCIANINRFTFAFGCLRSPAAEPVPTSFCHSTSVIPTKSTVATRNVGRRQKIIFIFLRSHGRWELIYPLILRDNRAAHR